jgi:hypothetical protein
VGEKPTKPACEWSGVSLSPSPEEPLDLTCQRTRGGRGGGGGVPGTWGQFPIILTSTTPLGTLLGFDTTSLLFTLHRSVTSTNTRTME